MQNKRAVIYARFSSSGQRDESIEGQLRECGAFAARAGYEVVGEYSDRALTGTNDRRPAFQRMIADAQKELFDAVICWKHDRFARNRYDSAIYKARLKSHGVIILYAMEAVPEGPEGIILDSVMEGYAEYYSANLSQNVKRGLYDSARQRLTMGQICYGLIKGADGRFAHHPEQAPIVKRIFEEYAAGHPAIEITAQLNSEGYRTRAGALFDKNFVRQLIKNPKYKGVYQYADIYDEHGIPPIVSPDVWEQAQRMMDLHHCAPALKKDEGGYLLSGKLFCGHCEEKMTAGSGTSKTGRQYKYYTCNGRRKKSGCKKQPIDKDYIEDVVVETLHEIAGSDEFIDGLVDHYMRWQNAQNADADTSGMEARIAEIDRALENITRVIERGIFPPEFEVRIGELTQEREDLRHGIAVKSLEHPGYSDEEVRWFFQRFRGGDPADPAWRLFLVDTFLCAAYLFDDGRLYLQLNHAGKNERVGVDLLEEGENAGSCFARFGLPNRANSNFAVAFVGGAAFVFKRIKK